MRFSYSDQLFPPGMILPISVCAVADSAGHATDAIIDTGADISAIPNEVKTRLGLSPEGEVLCCGPLNGTPETVPTYFVRVRVGSNGEFVELEVVATPDRYFLLGRDWLNDFVLLADAPGGFFELNKPVTLHGA